MENTNTAPQTLAIAVGGSFAAGRDQHIHLHAIPCADCEQRFVRHAAGICRHCRQRGVVLVALLAWFVLLGGIALACAHAALGEDAFLVGAIATGLAVFLAGRWCARRLGFYGEAV